MRMLSVNFPRMDINRKGYRASTLSFIRAITFKGKKRKYPPPNMLTFIPKTLHTVIGNSYIFPHRTVDKTRCEGTSDYSHTAFLRGSTEESYLYPASSNFQRTVSASGMRKPGCAIPLRLSLISSSNSLDSSASL
jgi:hypothetical protein